jgi:HSP20 family protein
MHRQTFDLMEDQLRAIYRAVTGQDAPTATTSPDAPAAASPEELARRFTDLEAMARTIPAVAERVPPFAFAPPVDVVDEEADLLIETAIPGLDRADLECEVRGDTVILSGVRRGERAANGRTYLHAEIPRGPFRRVVRLPYAVSAEPRIEIERGLVHVRFRKPKTAPARA